MKKPSLYLVNVLKNITENAFFLSYTHRRNLISLLLKLKEAAICMLAACRGLPNRFRSKENPVFLSDFRPRNLATLWSTNNPTRQIITRDKACGTCETCTFHTWLQSPFLLFFRQSPASDLTVAYQILAKTTFKYERIPNFKQIWTGVFWNICFWCCQL